MSRDIDAFLARCRRDRAAVTPVRTLFKQFGESLPDTGKRSAWSRSNFLIELGHAGLCLSQIGCTDVVVGIGAPVGGWQVHNGRLHFSESAA